jgi:hypothetical protein
MSDREQHGAALKARVVLEAAERGKPSGVCMSQRYIPKKFLRRLKTISNVA